MFPEKKFNFVRNPPPPPPLDFIQDKRWCVRLLIQPNKHSIKEFSCQQNEDNVQGDQLCMAVCLWYLVKLDLSIVR